MERKVEQDESRIDSGIDSFKSIPRDQYPSLETCEEEKPVCGTEERLDSAFVSSSLTSLDGLEDLIDKCRVSDDINPTECECTEEEVNLLTTLTEDGDTYV